MACLRFTSPWRHCGSCYYPLYAIRLHGVDVRVLPLEGLGALSPPHVCIVGLIGKVTRRAETFMGCCKIMVVFTIPLLQALQQTCYVHSWSVCLSIGLSVGEPEEAG
jgi:hypothetical protein